MLRKGTMFIWGMAALMLTLSACGGFDDPAAGKGSLAAKIQLPTAGDWMNAYTGQAPTALQAGGLVVEYEVTLSRADGASTSSA